MALINLRNALMAGKRLPYDAEVEFLESTGTQWINTGYMLSGPTTFKLSASFTPTRDERDFFGAHAPNARGATVCGCYHNFVFGYNYPHPRIDGASLGSSEITTDIEYALSQSSRTLKVNGTTYSGNGATFPNLAVTLFRGNENTAYYGQFKCYAFQIYDANGTLVRDYISVRKGTVGYLYDRVSGKLFGNAGTGDFVVGQDVVPVEYIESHGTEWIDTGVYGSQNLRTTFDYQLEYSGTAPVAMGLFGCYTSGMKYHLYCSGAAPSEFQVGMGNTYLNTIRVDNVRHSIKFDDGAVSIDGNVVATFGPYEYPTGRTLLLFALQNASGGLYSMTPMRKWRVQMWDNGTPIRDYVPVRVGTGSTWEGAMMDVLTRRIYRNAGTGAFTYGNDLKYPIPAE